MRDKDVGRPKEFGEEDRRCLKEALYEAQRDISLWDKERFAEALKASTFTLERGSKRLRAEDGYELSTDFPTHGDLPHAVAYLYVFRQCGPDFFRVKLVCAAMQAIPFYRGLALGWEGEQNPRIETLYPPVDAQLNYGLQLGLWIGGKFK